MPGLTIAAGNSIDTRRVIRACERSAPKHYSTEVLYERADRVAVVWSAYESYPKTFITNSYGLAVVEGTVLDGEMSTEETLHRLVYLWDCDRAAAAACAVDMAKSADGDFIIILVCFRDGAITVVNDVFGRLPLYVRKTFHECIAAREIKTIVEIDGPGSLDIQAAAHTLLFGFPLNRHTLIDDIRVLGPATSLSVSLEPFGVDANVYRVWNFEELVASRQSERPDGSDLVDIFQRTCARQSRRPGLSPPVLQLSGGLDSRAVAGGLSTCGTPFYASTFATPEGDCDRDVAIAERTARLVDAPWQLFRLRAPSWAEIIEASLLRDGLNYGGMAPRLQYLTALRTVYGPKSYVFTGDGGDKVFPDLRAPWWVNDLRRYVDYRLQDVVWPLEDVAAMLGLNRKTLRDSLHEIFASYPESDSRQREVHFLIFERAWGWLAEGEERNRSYLWHQTPFYGRTFFEAVMSLPQGEKKGYRLYNAFLNRLNPSFAGLPNAKWNAPVRSFRARSHEWRASLKNQIPATMRSYLRAARKAAVPLCADACPVPAEIFRHAETILKDPCVANVFRISEVRERLSTCTELQFYYFVTQAVFVQQCFGGGATAFSVR